MHKDLKTAIEAALKAGKAVMQVYNTAFEVEVKADNSPITQADQQANTIINSFLEPTKTPIISEENKQTAFSIRKEWKKCWIVDPVDGTKEFVKKNDEFTINIALIINGNPQLGVVYAPALKVLYFADCISKKAYKTNLDTLEEHIDDVFKKAKPLQPSLSINKAIKVLASRSHINKKTTVFIENLKEKGFNVEVNSVGSSLKFCFIAEGFAHVYPRFGPTMEWDSAAGHAICNAVNIEVFSAKNKNELTYNKQNLLNPDFLVINKHLLKQI